MIGLLALSVFLVGVGSLGSLLHLQGRVEKLERILSGLIEMGKEKR